MKDKRNQKIRRWSIISGISLLIMAIAAGYAYGYVLNQIYVSENVAATLDKIEANYTLYITGIIAWGIIFLTDLLVSYGFYVYLKAIHKKMALISGLIRLVYAFILGVGIIFLIKNDVHIFDRIWSLGLIIFGFHLTLTGIILIKEKSLLKILSMLLIIAGLSYSLVHAFYNFLPDLNSFTSTLETNLTLPMTMGELFFGIYLLIKGGKRTSQPLLNDSAQVFE